MPARSKIAHLPEPVRAELDRKLVGGMFSDYEGLARWLNDQGFQIGKSCVHEYGQKLEADFNKSMANMRALVALTRASDDLGEVGSEIANSAAAILQTDIVRTVLELQDETDPKERAKMLATLTRAQADIGRLAISAEKHRAEVREKIKAKLAEMEQQTHGDKPKFDAATLKRVGEEFYGIV